MRQHSKYFFIQILLVLSICVNGCRKDPAPVYQIGVGASSTNFYLKIGSNSETEHVGNYLSERITFPPGSRLTIQARYKGVFTAPITIYISQDGRIVAQKTEENKVEVDFTVPD